MSEAQGSKKNCKASLKDTQQQANRLNAEIKDNSEEVARQEQERRLAEQRRRT